MKFLQGLLRRLKDWWRGNPDRGFDPFRPVDANEAIARYFVSLSKINQSTKKLRAEAFVPHPHKEMSVFRVIEFTHLQTRNLGQAEFGDKLKEPRPVLGWGRFKAGVLGQSGIRLRLADWAAADGFHPRHRDVVGWPDVANDPKDTKAKQKEVALELSEQTTIVMAEGTT